jgi:hypothetical protein
MDTAAGLVPSDTVRGRLRRRLGGYSPLLRWYRRLRPAWLWQRINPRGRITRCYVDEQGLTVRHGPFAGMIYPAGAVGRVGFLPAKLLGSYELELAPYLSSDDWDIFADIGSGDGYFCVGMARRHPDATIIGYETDAAEQKFCKHLAEINGANIEVRGTASRSNIQALPPGKLLLMIDIEGAEYELVNPKHSPRLSDATIIVELHWWVHENIENVLRDRFSETHQIEVIQQTTRSLAEFPELARWDEQSAYDAMSEGRSHFGRWMVLTVKT